MQAHIQLGRISGIKIGLNYTWIIIAVLITFSLASRFQLLNPQWGPATAWATAIVTALLFFTAIVAHELSHALVARLRGLPVRSITLFALGGVAHIEQEAADAKTEFWMGIAGPIMSVLVGLLCLGFARGVGWEGERDPATPLLAMLVWLGYINIVLAAFNMIPGFPMDGGRVLRAVIWWVTGNQFNATRIAARVGQLVALLFIFLGILGFFRGMGIAGLWIVFIGWFLHGAAGATYAQVEVSHLLHDVKVSDVMTRDCPVLESNINLQTFVDEYVLRSGRRCLVLMEGASIAGLITPQEVRSVDRSLWHETTVRDAMRPFEKVRTVAPETPLQKALEIMVREDLNQLPVVTKGKLEGLLTRSNALQFLETRKEMAM